jgi:sugar lactone lactonase YvrE
VVTAIAFREGHPGSYIASTTLGIAVVEEKTGAIQMLKRKPGGPSAASPLPRRLTPLTVELLPDSARGKVRFNDGAVDCKGRFWVGETDREACQIPLSDQPHPPQRSFVEVRPGRDRDPVPGRRVLFERDRVVPR